MCIPLKGYCFIGGQFRVSCLRELACVITSDTICKCRRNSKPTCDHRKVYGSMIRWLMFHALRMSVNAKNNLQKNPIEKWPRSIVVFTTVANCFHMRKWRLFKKKCGLEIFALDLRKRICSPGNTCEWDGTFEGNHVWSINVCCTT